MRAAILILALPALCSGAIAATIYVPDHYPTIQDAIGASLSGDTVIVRPGTYLERIDFLGKAIILRSEMGPGATVIDGNEAGIVVTFQSGEDARSVLDGFTVTNGFTAIYQGHCGGILCDGSSPTITGNIISENDAGRDGGGIRCYGSFAVITNNTIRGNTAGMNGGGISCSASSPNILHNRIEGNLAVGSGGGINCFLSSSPMITHNRIEGNTGRSHSGGIHCQDSSPIIENNVILGNATDRVGGGITCFSSFPPITNNSIAGNSAYYHGGGIYLDRCSPAINGNAIRGNRAGMDGGGLCCFNRASPVVRNSQIIGNLASNDGGGVFCFDLSDPELISTALWGNEAGRNGGGAHCGTSCKPLITNCTFSGNRALSGGGVYCKVSTSLPIIENSILWGDAAQTFPEIFDTGTIIEVSYSDVAGGYPGAGNIDADPLFANAANDDFHLTWPSPCHNTGDNTAVTKHYDFEGDPRITLGTVDMGADEYYPHLYHDGEVGPGKTVVFKAIGIPGAGTTLCRGPGLRNPPLPTPYGDLHLQWPLTFHNNGTFPASGYSEKAYTLPTGISSGQKLHYQLFTGGRLWNLMTLVVE